MPTLNVIGVKFGAIGGNAAAIVPVPFIMTIDTTKTSTGSSANNQFRLPLVNTGVYDMVVDWGDGNSDTITVWNAAAVTHTYASLGVYTVSILGKCEGWRYANTGDRLKLTNISQFGNGLKITTNGAFNGAANLLGTASDKLIIATADCSNMFRGCTAAILTSAGSWDVSGVTNMSQFFGAIFSFNTNINSWDVSNVTNMSFMFSACRSFNQPLNNWNTSKVTTMQSMFAGTSNLIPNPFNQDISSWDVSKVLTFFNMFNACNFNQPINNWNTSSALNMQQMFSNNSQFNQPINNWNVSLVQSMASMFANNNVFNQPLNNWNTGSVTNISFMFSGATGFNQTLTGWDVSKVTTTQSMFVGATSFNQPINNWNLTSIINMSTMFDSLTNFNSSLSNWTIGSQISNMQTMFRNCTSFNQNLNWTFAAKPIDQGVSCVGMFVNATSFNNGGAPLSWTIRIQSPTSMFQNCTAFNQNVGNFLFSTGLSNANRMFYNATSFNNGGSADIGNWQFLGDTTVDASEMFSGCINFNQPLNNLFTVARARTAYLMFEGCTAFNGNVGNWKFGTNVIGGKVWIEGMFSGCESFNNGGSPDINNWDFTTVTTGFEGNQMGGLFAGCVSFNQPLNNWDVSKVSVFTSMFEDCTAFNQPLNNWNLVSSAIIMERMFANATSYNQPILWVDVDAFSIIGMFSGCTAFNNGGQDMPLRKIFINSNIIQYDNLFDSCTSFNQKINYDGVDYIDPFYNVVTADGMFAGATAFNNGGVALPLQMNQCNSVRYMFYQCTSFNQNVAVGGINNISIWTSVACDFEGMFYGATSFNNGGSSDINLSLTCFSASFNSMFYGATAFNQSLEFWMESYFNDLTALSFMGDKTPATFPAATYDALLIGWSASLDVGGTPLDVQISFGSAKYTAAASAARLNLEDNYGWLITDGGQV